MMPPGIHVVSNTRKLRGFRIWYNEESIYAIQVVRQDYDACSGRQPDIKGIKTCGFEMLLDRVDEVVATFEVGLQSLTRLPSLCQPISTIIMHTDESIVTQGRKLVGLGIRGVGKRLPSYGHGPWPPTEWV
ncbi:uncharacterized protein BJX67DRAFT_344772, partial [Aspergillus lucknowensis]